MRVRRTARQRRPHTHTARFVASRHEYNSFVTSAVAAPPPPPQPTTTTSFRRFIKINNLAPASSIARRDDGRPQPLHRRAWRAVAVRLLSLERNERINKKRTTSRARTIPQHKNTLVCAHPRYRLRTPTSLVVFGRRGLNNE